jgi:hypothetical protein
MPITLQTLFCAPQDVWDLLSSEGVDLREDDHNLATGQIIVTTSDTPVGSIVVTVAPIPVPLLAGAQLTFDGAGMPAPVSLSLASVASVGATSLSVAPTATDVPAGAQARDSGVNAATGARLLVGVQKGTSKVKLYCNQRYDDSQLKLAGSVLHWAAVGAAKFLCTRRAQGCPKGIKADYDEAIEEMKMVQSGQLSIEDIGTRGIDWPTVTNVIVNPGYDGMRARVEPNISEQTPTAYSQFIDWNSAFLLDF